LFPGGRVVANAFARSSCEDQALSACKMEKQTKGNIYLGR
jgi:hypothetical protein